MVRLIKVQVDQMARCSNGKLIKGKSIKWQVDQMASRPQIARARWAFLLVTSLQGGTNDWFWSQVAVLALIQRSPLSFQTQNDLKHKAAIWHTWASFGCIGHFLVAFGIFRLHLSIFWWLYWPILWSLSQFWATFDSLGLDGSSSKL